MRLAALREARELDLVDVHADLHRIDRTDRHATATRRRILARAHIDEEHGAVDRAADRLAVQLGERRIDLRRSALDTRARHLGGLLARHALDLRNDFRRAALHQGLQPRLLVDELRFGDGEFGARQPVLGLGAGMVEFPERVASLHAVALRDEHATDHAGIGGIDVGHPTERLDQARGRDAALEGTRRRRDRDGHVKRAELHLLHGSHGGDEAGNGQDGQDDRSEVHACSLGGTSARVTRPSSMWTMRFANR